jgi:hypothetical protein
MQRKRRSGRITKEIPIVLLGTDATGKVFSEETNTVVLSRHGAGVVTRYRFSPDELLTLSPGLPRKLRSVSSDRLAVNPAGTFTVLPSSIPILTSGRWNFPPDPFEPASELMRSNAACAKPVWMLNKATSKRMPTPSTETSCAIATSAAHQGPGKKPKAKFFPVRSRVLPSQI